MKAKSMQRVSKAIAGLALLLAARLVSSAPEYTLITIAENLDNPWAVAQLPDESFLVTERTGQLLRVSPAGTTQVIEGVPASYFAGQGGLLDVVLHPEFASNQRIYLSYAHGTPDANATAITRATLDGNRLRDVVQILWVEPTKATPQHYGGRMLFLPDGTLLITVGEGFDYREVATRSTW